ncbi:MAG: hypothetical protein HYT31_01860 [Parcubacteria group bacterium]|nr:hypothetical protein [Parcubacteria group bacterium]
MYITVHAAAGAALGTFTAHPLFAFIAGFISHLVLDMIPHGDETIKKWKLFRTVRLRIAAAALLDLIGVVLSLLFLVNNADLRFLPGMLAGMAGGIAPDALWGFHELTGTPLLNAYRAWHSKGHDFITTKKITLFQGFLVQLPLLAVFLWFAVSR